MTIPALHDRAENYLRLRRSFGYRLGGHDRPLADFVACLDRAGLHTVTVGTRLGGRAGDDSLTARPTPEHRPRIRHLPPRVRPSGRSASPSAVARGSSARPAAHLHH